MATRQADSHLKTVAVAVMGAGLMGSAIAQVFASAGHDVAIYDPNADARNRADERVGSIFRLLEMNRETSGTVTVHDTIEGAVGEAVLVIEAGPENLAVKRQIFATLVDICSSDTILATNTSALPIGEIAVGLPSRQRILGMHFWNPPYLVPLVEVIAAGATAEGVIAVSMELLRGAMLEPVLVRADVPGFIGNRLQHALKREAIALVASGVSSAEDIDTVVKYGFGMRLPFMGPLEQSDLVGLELTLAIHETLMPHLDRTATPHPFLVRKVRDGHTGAAVGQGFRSWTADQAEATKQQLQAGLLEGALRRRRDAVATAEFGK